MAKGNDSIRPCYGTIHGLPFSILKCGWIPMGADDFGNTFKIIPIMVRDYPYTPEPYGLRLQTDSNMQ